LTGVQAPATETGGRRVLLLSLGALAMTMLLPLGGLVFALFALAVGVRTLREQLRLHRPLGTTVAGLVISVFSLLAATVLTVTQLYFAEELAAYEECKKGAGTVSAQQQCLDALERSIETKVPFIPAGQLEFPFAP
jgi:hypothetical protein